jgi:hypothetical protein
MSTTRIDLLITECIALTENQHWQKELLNGTLNFKIIFYNIYQTGFFGISTEKQRGQSLQRLIPYVLNRL